MKPKKSNPFRSSAARLSLPFASALIALFTVPSAMAAVRYWDPLSSGGFGSVDGTITWATSTNLIWTASDTGGTTRLADYVTTTSDDLHFGGPTASLGAGTVPVGTVSAGTISFNTLSGNMLLSGGTITMKAAATITTVNASQAHTISSVITGAGTSLTKAGAGTLILSGANTYNGSTIISGGALVLNNASALGGTSGISMSAGTTLRADLGITTAAPITLSGTGNITIANGTNTAVTANYNGGITGNTTTLTFSTLNNTGNPAHVISLGAASSYSGDTTITVGSTVNNLTVRSGATNSLSPTTVLTFAQVNGSTSGRAMTFDLNGNNQTLAGLSNGGVVPQVRNMTVTSAAAATLTINNTADFTFGGRTISTTVATIGINTRAQISGAISLVKNGTGTFTLGGTLAGLATEAGNAFTGSTQILGGILVLGETLSIQNSAFDTAGSIAGDAGNGLKTTVTTLRLGGLTGNKNFADVFTSTGGYTGLTALTLNPGTGVTNSYAGDIGDGATGMTLTKIGTGTQILTGANTHTGGTTIANVTNGGNLRITHAGALGTGAVSILTAGANTGALELALTGTNTITNIFTGFNSAFTLTSTGNAQILNTSGTNKITSNLTITGTGGNGLNVVSEGGLLELSGTITSSVAAGPRTFSIGGSGDGLISGAIINDIINSHALAVTKSGSGTWTLSGVSTYLGNTTVVGGTLALTSTSGLTFAIGSSGINNRISGTGSGNVTMDGAFTFDLAAAGTGPTDSWNIVDLANLSGTSGFSSNFNVVGFTDDGGGLWSKDNLGTIYQFSQGTGLLTVIPEPSSAALLGALGAMLLLRRRR